MCIYFFSERSVGRSVGGKPVWLLRAMGAFFRSARCPQRGHRPLSPEGNLRYWRTVVSPDYGQAAPVLLILPGSTGCIKMKFHSMGVCMLCVKLGEWRPQSDKRHFRTTFLYKIRISVNGNEFSNVVYLLFRFKGVCITFSEIRIRERCVKRVKTCKILQRWLCILDRARKGVSLITQPCFLKTLSDVFLDHSIMDDTKPKYLLFMNNVTDMKCQ